MNLLLFRPHEVSGSVGRVEGERAIHIRDVLKKRVGDSLKAGVVGIGRGMGEILEDTPNGLTVRLGELTSETPPGVHLIIALPRPLALSRLLHTAASFGVRHIDLIRAWKVPRSYFASPRLKPDRVQDDLRLGAEQGSQTWVPTFAVHEGFRRFVEDALSESAELAGPEGRVILDPDAEQPFRSHLSRSDRKSLAFGPEGGFLPEELESFAKQGFAPVRLGGAILTTEIAIAASLAQLELLSALELGANNPC